MTKGNDRLLAIWSSADREVAKKMVFMYTRNAKKYGWWKDIQLLIWGPSAKLLAEDEEIQSYIHNMKNAGIELTACVTCADSYGVSDRLREMGVDVKPMGQPLTEMIKEGWATITF